MRAGQHNFSKGEISDELVARVDVDAYAAGLKRAKNVVILKYGGITKRPGTRFVSEVYKDEGCRLLPFQFATEQTYALEFGQGYMRIAAGGGMVIEERLTVQAITVGAQTLLTVNYHDYVAGDQVFFSETGCDWLDDRICKVTQVLDDNQFAVDIDSNGLALGGPDTGGIIRTGPPVPPPPPPVVPPVVPPIDPPDITWPNDFKFNLNIGLL